MYPIAFLILFPIAVGLALFCIRVQKIRKAIGYITAPIIMIATGILVWTYFADGGKPVYLYYNTGFIDHIILAVEILLMFFITFLCFRYKKYWISLLSIIPTCLIAWYELAGPAPQETWHIKIDNLSVLMCVIIGVIASLIVIYAMGYMDGYHEYHKEIQERRHYFFMIVYIFIGAMFGFVLSDNLLWIDLFWEITSVCSFLLIGYTRLEEAITNSFRALWMNLLGGVALAVGIVYFGVTAKTVSLTALVVGGASGMQAAVVAVALIAFAAMTKAAQLPFSTWLMGAMVAPTPSSALLHSATMVKAGIYVLIRLAPAMSGHLSGTMVTFVGGVTFLMGAVMAIAQSDAKKVLAMSTISNLGLMAACAGVGSSETVWAAIFLMIFHAVSKSLLFQDVGAVENTIHSRDIENMQGLVYRLPMLAIFMFIGIAGMFLAPFGMLVSKWAALRAAVDTRNILMVFFIVFGSALTSVYWTKWLGKLIGKTAKDYHDTDVTKNNERVSIIVHGVLMVLLCILFPVLSIQLVDPYLVTVFGRTTIVLPMRTLYMLIGLIILIFLVPLISYRTSRGMHFNLKPAYTGGITQEHDYSFTDSFGGKKKLYLTNFYFGKKIGLRRVMLPSQIACTAAIILLLSMVIGGAL